MSISPVRRRVTIGAAVAIFVLMAVWGVVAVTTPIALPDFETTCAPEDQIRVEHLEISQVQVSVYNAGETPGLARDTLERFERNGFRPGEVGNVPDGITVAGPSVLATDPTDEAARLVAMWLGEDAQIIKVESEYGPGVDVVVTDGFGRLNRQAPTQLKLDEPIINCDRS